MAIDSRIDDALRQLRTHPYDTSASEFVRVRVDTTDDTVAGVVRSMSAEDDRARDQFRRGLGEDEATVQLFAMRRTLQARRQSSISLVHEALDAFALLSSEGVPWDSWLKASLFVARPLGVDLELVRRRFANVAHPDAAARFDVALEAMNRVQDLTQCSIVEVTTKYGVGFIETFIFRDSPTIALRGAPRQSDNRVDYQPRSNIAQLTVLFADALDQSSTYLAGPITQDQLAATSFSLTASGSYLPTTGCLSFVAAPTRADASFTVFVAEFPDETDVEALADAAMATADQSAIFLERRLIVLSPQPNFDSDADVYIDFSEPLSFARDALGDPSTR